MGDPALIDPAQLPGSALQPDVVAEHAGTIATSGAGIREGGAGVQRAWQGMPAVFAATGSEHLYAVMAPVESLSASVGAGLEVVARALSSYAERVGPIKARLDALRVEAGAFTASANGYKGRTTASHQYWTGSSVGTMPGTEYDHWYEDPKFVDRNNALIRRGAELEAQLLEAQQDCASAIRGAVGLTATQVTEEHQYVAALRSNGALQTPWGSTANRKESCSEKVTDFPARFLWNGVIVGGAGGLLRSVGSLAGFDGHSQWEALHGLVTGNVREWWQGERDSLSVAGRSWLGVAHLASGLAQAGSPGGWAVLQASAAGGSQWSQQDGSAVLGLMGLVGLTPPKQWWKGKSWNADAVTRRWQDDPGGTAGSSLFNVGSFFIPGAAEAKGGAEAAEAGGDAVDAAQVARDAARAAGRFDSSGVERGLERETGLPEGALSGAGALGRLTPAGTDLSRLDHLQAREGAPVAADAAGVGNDVVTHGVPAHTVPAHDLPTHVASTQDVPAHALPTRAASPDNLSSHGEAGHAGGEAAEAHSAPASPTQSAAAVYAPVEIRPVMSARDFEQLPADDRMRVATAEVEHGAVVPPTGAAAAAYGRGAWSGAGQRVDPWQEDAIKDYTRENPVGPHGITFREINAELRTGTGSFSEPVGRQVAQIDSALQIRPVPETTVITRGTNIGHWIGDPADLAGTKFTERSYISSSLGDVAAPFANYDAVLHLRVPNGTPALWLEDVSYFGGGERELLLGRDLEWVVTRVVSYHGQWHVFGEFLR